MPNFVFSTSRGENEDIGVIDERLWSDSSPAMSGMRPSVEDILIAYSTVPGYKSWRESIGSLYVQTLCRVRQKLWTRIFNYLKCSAYQHRSLWNMPIAKTSGTCWTWSRSSSEGFRQMERSTSHAPMKLEAFQRNFTFDPAAARIMWLTRWEILSDFDMRL